MMATNANERSSRDTNAGGTYLCSISYGRDLETRIEVMIFVLTFTQMEPLFILYYPHNIPGLGSWLVVHPPLEMDS